MGSILSRALILGVNGQDGSYLAELLLRKGCRVASWIPENIPIDLGLIQHLAGQFEMVKGDLRDQEGMEACLRSFQPDEIYNFASPSSPAASWEMPVDVGDITALGVARLLEAVRRAARQARFYQASSSELFGEPLEAPQNEATPFQPRNPYGIAKLYAHWMTVRYRDHFGLYAVSGILFNHESPRRGLEFVTRKITHTAARIKLGLADELHLGDLDARRDWGFAGDYVQAIWLMLQQEQPRDYVIGTGETHSVREFCEQAFACLGLDYRDYVVQDPAFVRPPETRQLVADARRARDELGWQPQVGFNELVKMMVEADWRALQGTIIG